MFKETLINQRFIRFCKINCLRFYKNNKRLRVASAAFFILFGLCQYACWFLPETFTFAEGCVSAELLVGDLETGQGGLPENLSACETYLLCREAAGRRVISAYVFSSPIKRSLSRLQHKCTFEEPNINSNFQTYNQNSEGFRNKSKNSGYKRLEESVEARAGGQAKVVFAQPVRGTDSFVRVSVPEKIYKDKVSELEKLKEKQQEKNEAEDALQDTK